MSNTHIDGHSCLHANMYKYITCIDTYITYTYQPTTILSFRVKYFHNFSYLHISRISIFLEIWKFDFSGKTDILQIM